MKALEIVEIIKKDKPELLGNVPEKRAAALIREAFVQLLKKLDEQNEQDGMIRVPGLGSFRTRIAEKVKEGQKVSEKRIMFRPAKPAPGKTGKRATKNPK